MGHEWSPLWVGMGHDPPGKIKKLINLICKILNNFVTFFYFRDIQISVKWCSGTPRRK